jgi:hypothetical protein
MKAQAAVEFMIIFGAFLIALTLVVVAAWNNIVNINESTIDFEANRILNLATDRINTAYLEGHGFSISLVIPEKIGVYDYTLDIEENSLWLTINEVSYSNRLLTSNVTGNLQGGENKIENVNGGIVIS